MDPSQLHVAVQILGDVSETIAELHEAGYVHRDLKPSNVMWLPRESRWVLIDFGMATTIGKRAAMGFTPTYAAPEVLKCSLKGKKSIVADAAVDAWSLGVIAFELLTGAPPFASSREVRILGHTREVSSGEVLRLRPVPFCGRKLGTDAQLHRRKRPCIVYVTYQLPQGCKR